MQGIVGCMKLRLLFWQVVHTYSMTALRSDYSLLHYGFTVDEERPLLAGNDHISGFEHPTDDLYSASHLPRPALAPHPCSASPCPQSSLSTTCLEWHGHFVAGPFSLCSDRETLRATLSMCRLLL